MRKGIGLIFCGLIFLGLMGCVSSAQKEMEQQKATELARIEAQRQEEAERKAAEEAEKNTLKEAEIVRKAKMVTARSGMLFSECALENWESAFSDRASAEAWLKDTLAQNKAVNELITAREEVYNRFVNAFKMYPNKPTLDELTKAKQNIIEGYNRFKPIIANVNTITAKGAVFVERLPVLDENFQEFPVFVFAIMNNLLRDDAAVDRWITNLENEYQKLIDTYPVN